MTHNSDFAARRPVSVWNRPLNADFREMFKTLGSAIEHATMGNWAALAGDAVSVLTTIGFEKEPAQLAWVLIRRALTSAIFDLTSESLTLLREKAKDDEVLLAEIQEELEKTEVSIDASFFNMPGDLPLVGAVASAYGKWLQAHGATDLEVRLISARFRSYFVYALNDEWRRNLDTYKVITEVVDTPFTSAGRREAAWAAYTARLQKMVQESILGESFGLSSIYVPLRAVWYREDKSSGRSIDEVKKQTPVAGDLGRMVSAWLTRAEPNDAIRVISGGPGSGKSSFARMFAAQYAQKERVLFIPLHQLDLSDDLPRSIADYVRVAEIVPHDPLNSETGEERLLVIFDGLDEISKQGKLGAETAQQFLRDAEKMVDRRNLQRLRLQVLITGREVTVQAQKQELKKPGEILHAMPYVKPNVKGLEDPDNVLEHDQRQTWWQLYGSVSEHSYDKLPEALARPEFEEVTAQPLLNHLVALSYTRDQKKFESATVTLNELYADLLKAVYERAYERRPYAPIRELSEEDFLLLLEEIALSTWHGDGRTTTVKEIEERCRKSNLLDVFSGFKETAEAGVTRLLTAFYFRQQGQRREGEKTFEFTHKSFGEYLTARRLLRGVQRIDGQRERRRQSRDEGWTDREALIHWLELAGPSQMDTYLLTFIRREVVLIAPHVVTRWQQGLIVLFEEYLRAAPVDEMVPRRDFQTETRYARNGGETLLAVINACARFSKEVVKVEWPSVDSFGAWLSTLQSRVERPVAVSCLSHLDLTQNVLFADDLSEADLTSSLLDHADLGTCMFAEADLIRVSLRYSGAIYNLFDNAMIRETTFEHCEGDFASFRNCSIDGSNFDGSSLRYAGFDNARLKATTFRGADLQGTSFQSAVLRDCNFENADLRNADLRALITNCRFTGAKLDGAVTYELNKKALEADGADITKFAFVPDIGIPQERSPNIFAEEGWPRSE
jgi:uncharacterized protein YjbI with pentapeptide repeats/Mrp family chromosome partitioning ATPase